MNPIFKSVFTLSATSFETHLLRFWFKHFEIFAIEIWKNLDVILLSDQGNDINLNSNVLNVFSQPAKSFRTLLVNFWLKHMDYYD